MKADYEHITVFAHYELAMLLVQCSKDVRLINALLEIAVH